MKAAIDIDHRAITRQLQSLELKGPDFLHFFHWFFFPFLPRKGFFASFFLLLWSQDPFWPLWGFRGSVPLYHLVLGTNLDCSLSLPLGLSSVLFPNTRFFGKAICDSLLASGFCEQCSVTLKTDYYSTLLMLHIFVLWGIHEHPYAISILIIFSLVTLGNYILI